MHWIIVNHNYLTISKCHENYNVQRSVFDFVATSNPWYHWVSSRKTTLLHKYINIYHTYITYMACAHYVQTHHKGYISRCRCSFVALAENQRFTCCR